MPGTEPVQFFALEACREIWGIGQAILLLNEWMKAFIAVIQTAFVSLGNHPVWGALVTGPVRCIGGWRPTCRTWPGDSPSGSLSRGHTHDITITSGRRAAAIKMLPLKKWCTSTDLYYVLSVLFLVLFLVYSLSGNVCFCLPGRDGTGREEWPFIIIN